MPVNRSAVRSAVAWTRYHVRPARKAETRVAVSPCRVFLPPPCRMGRSGCRVPCVGSLHGTVHSLSDCFCPAGDVCRLALPLDLGDFLLCHSSRAPISLDGELLILIFTDGVSEAASPEGELFGETRALSVVRTNQTAGASQIVAALFQAVNDFRARQPSADDMTALLIKTPPPEDG